MAGRYIVAGPPCSGKSTYVRQQALRGDLIYDYDALHSALSGLDSHDHDDGIRPYVLAVRDRVLELAASDLERGLWVITSTHKTAELARLQAALSAKVVIMDVGRDEAHSRCDADSRPAEWHEYIDRWFDETDIDAAEWTRKTVRAPRRTEVHAGILRA